MADIDWQQAIRLATDPATRLATSARKAEWFAAMRWRRRVEAAFSEVQLTFTQWLVLEATRELIGEREDAVNQNQIAARVELGRSTVCQVMFTLQDKSLVSRDIDITGREMRIWLTSEAMQMLDAHRAQVEAVSASSR
jgi:DNA-binding MarR family transcriptional regulator